MLRAQAETDQRLKRVLKTANGVSSARRLRFLGGVLRGEQPLFQFLHSPRLHKGRPQSNLMRSGKI